MPPHSHPEPPVAVKARPAAMGDLEVRVRFNAAIAKETEGRQLNMERLRNGTRAVLESSEHGYYLVAETESVVVGQLFVTYEWSDWRNGMFWWIQSVYVEPSVRGRGGYRALHERVLKDARARGDVSGLRLYVGEENEAAQPAYARLGMTKTPCRVYGQGFVL